MSQAELEIIRRCTFDGLTRWQHVALQLGRSVDSVRSQYDPTYMRFTIRPSELVCEPCEPEEPTDLSSPHVRISLTERIIARLKLRSGSAQEIAAAVGSTVGSVRYYLSTMSSAGLVKHTERMPYTWSLARDAA